MSLRHYSLRRRKMNKMKRKVSDARESRQLYQDYFNQGGACNEAVGYIKRAINGHGHTLDMPLQQLLQTICPHQMITLKVVSCGDQDIPINIEDREENMEDEDIEQLDSEVDDGDSPDDDDDSETADESDNDDESMEDSDDDDYDDGSETSDESDDDDESMEGSDDDDDDDDDNESTEESDDEDKGRKKKQK